MRRRTLLAQGFALTPLATLVLSACGDDGDWAEGMLPIKWDRDTCLHCQMVISDKRFAVEIRGGPRNVKATTSPQRAAVTSIHWNQDLTL